eukprot:366272-Chlamydomonas_euryale.AAC.2
MGDACRQHGRRRPPPLQVLPSHLMASMKCSSCATPCRHPLPPPHTAAAGAAPTYHGLHEGRLAHRGGALPAGGHARDVACGALLMCMPTI